MPVRDATERVPSQPCQFGAYFILRTGERYEAMTDTYIRTPVQCDDLCQFTVYHRRNTSWSTAPWAAHAMVDEVFTRQDVKG